MKACHGWCLAVMLCFVYVPALACVPESKRVEVTGQSHVVLEPDYTEWVVDLVVTDKKPAVAMEVDKKMTDSLREIMKDGDVEKADMVVGRPKFTQNTTEKHKWSDGAGYTNTTVHRRVVFKLRDLEEVPEVFLAIHNLGVTYRYAYKSSKYDATLEQAKVDALKDAKAIAQKQVAVLGQTLGPALRVWVGEGGDRLPVFTNAPSFDLNDALVNGGVFGSDRSDDVYDPSAAKSDGRVHVRAYAEVHFELAR